MQKKDLKLKVWNIAVVQVLSHQLIILTTAMLMWKNYYR